MVYKAKLARLAQHIPLNLRTNFTRGIFYAAVDYIEKPVVESYHLAGEFLKKYLFYARYGHTLKKFKDIHQGKRCFIIGNGPSIRQQDLTKLKDEITFVVNWFVLHEQYNEINPTYHCIVASQGYFLASDSDAQLRDTNAKLHQLLREKSGNAVKFLNYHVRPYVDSHNLFPGHQVYYLNHSHLTSVSKRGMSPDITKAVYHGNTSIIDFCLHLALYMGFSEAYLLGCDCTLQFEPTGSTSKSHFHADYPVWGIYKKELPPGDDPQKHSDTNYNNMMKAYAVVRETFEQRGRKVYNAGVGGRLEIFERVNYDELF